MILYQVVVITGDNQLTGEAICREIGIFGPDETLKGKSMTGRQFVEMDTAERQRVLQVCWTETAARRARLFQQSLLQFISIL